MLSLCRRNEIQLFTCGGHDKCTFCQIKLFKRIKKCRLKIQIQMSVLGIIYIIIFFLALYRSIVPIVIENNESYNIIKQFDMYITLYYV